MATDAAIVAQGREAVGRYACASCHRVPGVTVARRASCVGCHEQTLRTAGASLGVGPHIVHYIDVPDLSHVTNRIRPDYLARYLMDPHDVRPGLSETMPRLPVTEEDAHAIVAFLTSVAQPVPPTRAGPIPSRGHLERGAQVFARSGCASCHRYGNHDPGFAVPDSAVQAGGPAFRLAPNLRFVRERMGPDRALQWIRDPASLDAAAHMPTPTLSEADLIAVRDFLFLGDPGPAVTPRAPPTFADLTPLDRPVRFAEVRRLFGRSCIHCHAHASDAGAATDLGFAPIALDLSSHRGVLLGTRLPDGTRRSILQPDATGVPPLLARLLRRHEEATRDLVPAGRDTLAPATRSATAAPSPVGMPLGLPPMSITDMRIIATWTQQLP